MTLIDFIIRIRLVGGAAARDLRKIMRESEATKASLNKAGASAEGFNKKIDQTAKKARTAKQQLADINREIKKTETAAAKAQAPLNRFLRTLRVGGGTRIPGLGTVGGSLNLSSLGGVVASIGNLGPMGVAAASALVVLAGAAVGAAKALEQLREVQKVRAAQVIAINPRRADGSLKTGAEVATERQANASRAERRPGQFVNGVNVLANQTVLDYEKRQESLMKVGFENLSDVNLAAFAQFATLAEGVSDDDLSKAAAVARKEAERRAGAGSGNKFDNAFREELGKVIKLAGDTKFSVPEAIRSQATAQALIEEAGLTSSEAFALQTISSDVESTARNSARHIYSFLVDSISSSDKKAVKELEGQGLQLFDAKGKFLGLENLIKTSAEFEKNGGNISTAFKRIFGEANVASLLDLVRSKDEFLKVVNSFNTDGTIALDNASFGFSQTIDFAEKRLGAETDAFFLKIGQNTGVGDAYVSVLNWMSDTIFNIGENFVTLMNDFRAAKRVLGLFFSGNFNEADKVYRESVANKGKTNTGKRPTATATSPQQAGAAASGALAVQKQVIDTAAKVDAAATDGQAKAQMFSPILQAASRFAVALPMFVQAARFGVQSELFRMLATMYQMAPQFSLAGQGLGNSFAAGLRVGVAGAGPGIAPGAVPRAVAGSVVNYTDNRQVRGATPTQVATTAKQYARGTLSDQTRRTNLGR